jgi:hypothetical protein
LATALSVPFLGRLPVYQPISVGSDRRHPHRRGRAGFGGVARLRSGRGRSAAQVAIAAYVIWWRTRARFRSYQ